MLQKAEIEQFFAVCKNKNSSFIQVFQILLNKLLHKKYCIKIGISSLQVTNNCNFAAF